MIKDAETILTVCGLGSYVHLYCGAGHLSFELLKRGVDLLALDPSLDVIQMNLNFAPERFQLGSLEKYPFVAEQFDTVIIENQFAKIATEDLVATFKHLYQLTKKNLVVYFSDEILSALKLSLVKQNRAYWERLAFESGFRLHPRTMAAIAYEHLEDETLQGFLYFEKIPPHAKENFSDAALLANLAQMDMLTQTGRQSDAAQSRYIWAAKKIRAHDRVLDLSCGSGFGTYMMAKNSKGKQFIGISADASSLLYANTHFAVLDHRLSYLQQNLFQMHEIAANSIDLVVGFDTIEYIENFDVFLQEISRILKPDGKIMSAVPNLWQDQAGKKLAARHHQLFDWQKLAQCFRGNFIIAERWAQTAGGGAVFPEKKRSLWPIPLETATPVETEWWLILAMVNSLEASESSKCNYQNFFQPETGQMPEYLRFDRYYDNPWLYRTMVQMGDRIEDKMALIDFSSKVVDQAQPGSADQGAALCVLAYQMLELGRVSSANLNRLVQKINQFNGAYAKENIHAHRWAISLHYVAGRLLLLFGNRSEALAAFMSCAAMDPSSFSPLLATKTISSRMYAGIILMANHQPELAKEQFILGIRAANKALQGDWLDIIGAYEAPFLFSLQEISEVTEQAHLCAQALHLINQNIDEPGLFWQEINLKHFGLVEWAKALTHENNILRKKQT